MNKEELLHLASRLAESASKTTISKVEQAAKAAWKRFQDTDMWRKEFLEMLTLYCKQKDILGVDKTGKADFENFVTNVLNVNISKGNVIVWNNKELSDLIPEQVFFVLGWARRLAKKEDSPNRPSAFMPESIVKPASETTNNKVKDRSIGKNNKSSQKHEGVNGINDDMIKALAMHFNSKRF